MNNDNNDEQKVPSRAEALEELENGGMSLLREYKRQQAEPVDCDAALAAIKLARHANLFYPKKYLSRFRQKVAGTSDAEYDRLYSENPDDLIHDAKLHPEKYDRSILLKVATHHLMRANHVDVPAYERGLQKHGLWEGVHSAIGRAAVVTSTGAGVLINFGAQRGSHLLAAQDNHNGALHLSRFGKAAKLLLQLGSQYALSPYLTGIWRIKTNARQDLIRDGGAPNLAKNIASFKHLDENYLPMRDADENLRALRDQLRTAGQPSGELLQQIQDGLQEAANAENKIDLTVAGNEQQTISKEYGAWANAWAGIGQTITTVAGAFKDEKTSLIVAGTGLAIQTTSIFTQWLAGTGDKGPVHPYSVTLNVDLGDYWKKDAADIPIEERNAGNIDPAAVRATWTSAEQQKIKNIQEIYKHRLGEIKRQIRDIQMKSSEPAVEDGTFANLNRDFQNLLNDVGKFESFDENIWKTFDSDGVIARCLNNHETFRQELEIARLAKPGQKSSQISQRYYHALHTILLSPAVSALTAQIVNLTDVEEAKKIIISAFLKGVGDGLHLPFMTGEVRVEKADNQEVLKAILETARQTAANEEENWRPTATVVLPSGKTRTIPIVLTETAGFDNFVHDYWQQWGRVFSIAPKNLVSGVKALYYSSRAFPARNSARNTAQEILDLLRRAPNVEHPFLDDGEAKRQATLMAAYDEVRTYRTRPLHAPLSVADRRALLPPHLREVAPKQWEGMPVAGKEPFAVNVRPSQPVHPDLEAGQGAQFMVGGRNGERSLEQREADIWEASFREFVDTEKAHDVNVDRDALMRAFVMLSSPHRDDRLIMPEIARGLGIDHDIAKKGDFLNRAKSLVLDYLPAALSLAPVGIQQSTVAKNWSSYVNGGLFAVNFVVQLGVIPFLRKRIKSYDNERAAIQSIGGVPNFKAIVDDTLTPASARAQAAAAATALVEARAHIDLKGAPIESRPAIDEAFKQATAAKKAIKRQKAIEEIENTSTAAQDIANWVINLTYAIAPVVGWLTKDSRNTFYAGLGANLLTGLMTFFTAGQKSASESTKKLKAVVEFFDCRTEEAIEAGREPMKFDQSTGRLVPNPEFTRDDIDPVKVRQMWRGYCQQRLDSVERQIDGRIENIDAQIAGLRGITLAEWNTYEHYESMRCGNSTGYGAAQRYREQQERQDPDYDHAAHREAEINAHEPLNDVAAARLETLERLAGSNAMSVQMWNERRALQDSDLSGDVHEQARLRRLDLLARQSPTPDQWKELEILRIRKPCTPHDEEILQAKESWIFRRISGGSDRHAAEAEFNASVERARQTIGHAERVFDEAVLDYADGLPANKEAIRADIARRMAVADEHQAELTRLLTERDRLRQQKTALQNNWPALDGDIKGILDRVLTGGLWADVATAWEASSYARTSAAEKLQNAYGNNNRFFSIFGHGLPVLADSSLMLWEAMINQHAPESCKESLLQTGSALAHGLRAYQAMKAKQPNVAAIEKRQGTIEPPGTIIAGSDGVTIIGPGATQIINSSKTYIAGPGGTLSYPTALPSPSTASATVTTSGSSSLPTITSTPTLSTISSSASTITSSPTPTATPVPPPVSCTPSPGHQHEEVPLAATIARIVGVLVVAGYAGAENKGLKNAIAKYWRGIKSAQTTLSEAEDALRKAIRANERAAVSSDDPPGDDKSPPEGSRIAAEKAAEKSDKDDVLLVPKAEEAEVKPKGSMEIEKIGSSGLISKVTNYLWGSDTSAKPFTEEVIQVKGGPQEYLAAVHRVVSQSLYSMPILPSGEEILRNGSIHLEWKSQANGSDYVDDFSLAKWQAEINELRKGAELLPINGKQALDHFLLKLKAEAVKAWYEQHVAKETNIRIEQAPPYAKTPSETEESSTEMSQCHDVYMAMEGFLDETIDADAEKRAMAEFKFSLVYREFSRAQTEHGSGELSCDEFKKFLVCYLKGQQNALVEKIRAPSGKTTEMSDVDIAHLGKLERAVDLLSPRDVSLPSLVHASSRHSENAYRSFAAAEQVASGATTDNEELFLRFIDLFGDYHRNAQTVSVKSFDEFLLHHYRRRAESATDESIWIRLPLIEAVLTNGQETSAEPSPTEISLSFKRSDTNDSGIGLDDRFEAPLMSPSSSEDDIAEWSRTEPRPLTRSGTASSQDSGVVTDAVGEVPSQPLVSTSNALQETSEIEGTQRETPLAALQRQLQKAFWPEFEDETVATPLAPSSRGDVQEAISSVGRQPAFPRRGILSDSNAAQSLSEFGTTPVGGGGVSYREGRGNSSRFFKYRSITKPGLRKLNPFARWSGARKTAAKGKCDFQEDIPPGGLRTHADAIEEIRNMRVSTTLKTLAEEGRIHWASLDSFKIPSKTVFHIMPSDHSILFHDAQGGGGKEGKIIRVASDRVGASGYFSKLQGALGKASRNASDIIDHSSFKVPSRRSVDKQRQRSESNKSSVGQRVKKLLRRRR